MLGPMILVAALMPFEVNIVGRLMASEVVCIIIVVGFFASGRSFRFSKQEKLFYILLLIWLANQALTDIYLGTPFIDYTRGWSRMVFFALNFTAMHVLIDGKRERAVLLYVLIAMGAAVKFYTGSGNIEKTGELNLDWKFGYGAAFTILVMYIGARLTRNPSSPGPSAMLGLGAAAVNLAMNARSLFGQSAAGSILALLARSAQRTGMGSRSLALIGISTICVGYGLVELYSYAASEGILGADAKTKYERQADNDLGLLLGGRTELLGSLAAIGDSPIIGYGSYARDLYYAELRFVQLQQAGIIPMSKDIEDDRIPTHSFLFGAWVEAGILGALFWIWMLYVVARGMFQTIKQPDRYTSLILFAGTAFAWDILFSPFGLDRRLVAPAMLHVILWAGPLAAPWTNPAAQSHPPATGRRLLRPVRPPLRSR